MIVLSVWIALSNRKVDQHMIAPPTEDCSKAMICIKDAVEALQGRWKLPILYALCGGPKRFKEIANEVLPITDKSLSKELKELQTSKLIKREVLDVWPHTVTYTLTEHGKTLRNVLYELWQWGAVHREEILRK